MQGKETVYDVTLRKLNAQRKGNTLEKRIKKPRKKTEKDQK